MNSTQVLLTALQREIGGIAVVWCGDFGLRDWLVEEVAGLAASDAAPLRTASVDEAVRTPHRLVLLIPADEAAAIEELDGRRDQFLDPARTQPVVVFLLRDGAGQVALANAPSLASWVRGSDVDPDLLAEVDAPSERARFEAEVGQSVEAWLDRWRAEEIQRSGESFTRAYWAMLLEQR